MSTLFEDAWQNGGVLDDTFGETFIITPIVAPTSTTRVDDVNDPAVPMNPATTPAVTFVGVFRTVPAERFPESRGHAASDAQLLSAGLVAIEFQVAAIPFAPKQRDVIQRVSSGVFYEISDPGDELFGRRRVKITGRR